MYEYELMNVNTKETTFIQATTHKQFEEKREKRGLDTKEWVILTTEYID